MPDTDPGWLIDGRLAAQDAVDTYPPVTDNGWHQIVAVVEVRARSAAPLEHAVRYLGPVA